MTATTAPASRDRFEEADTADLDGLLAHRRWQRRARPFPHVVADSVFTPTFAHRLAEDFGRVFEGAGYDTNHDFVGTSLIRGRCGALDVFLSPGWLALAAGLFDVPGPCYLTGGIHRHRPGSRDGFPHNDIHPERLRRTTTPGELLTGSGSDRADGTAAGRSGTDAMPQGLAVRAVAMLYYLGDTSWAPGDGGETGLYWDWKDPVGQPVRRAAPRHNSLFAFGCNPHSYHSFMTNRRPRDSVIVFLYQPLEQYLAQWGDEGLRQYAEYGRHDV